MCNSNVRFWILYATPGGAAEDLSVLSTDPSGLLPLPALRRSAAAVESGEDDAHLDVRSAELLRVRVWISARFAALEP